MKTSKFSEEQIAYALKQNELGSTVDEVCAEFKYELTVFFGEVMG